MSVSLPYKVGELYKIKGKDAYALCTKVEERWNKEHIEVKYFVTFLDPDGELVVAECHKSGLVWCTYKASQPEKKYR